MSADQAVRHEPKLAPRAGVRYKGGMPAKKRKSNLPPTGMMRKPGPKPKPGKGGPSYAPDFKVPVHRKPKSP